MEPERSANPVSRQELIDHLEEIVKDAEAHLERLRAAIAQGMHFANLAACRV
jgi:hypothetical protein